MAKYKLISGGVMRDDGACIPDCTANVAWREYQEWLAVEGNMPDPQYTLEEVKSIKVLELRQSAFAAINAAYPTYKQININELQGFTQQDKDEMWVYINAQRDNCNAKEALVAAAETIEDVNAITW